MHAGHASFMLARLGKAGAKMPDTKKVEVEDLDDSFILAELTDEEIKKLRPAKEVFAELGLELPIPAWAKRQ